jgi:hypothetical protein
MLVALMALTMASAPTPLPDAAFEGRMRDSFDAAQALQGPLDGRWTLYDAGGRALYAIQIVDPAGGAGPLQAAWRDPRDLSPLGALGVVSDIARTGGALRVSFAGHGGLATNLVLRQGRHGGWSGRMVESGKAIRVTLRRD